MTKDKYLEICYEMGDTPNPDKCPPDLEDFPLDVQKAIVAYGKFGDRVAADIGYIGKDLSPLQVYMDLYDVESKELFIDTILSLDQRMIEKSAEAMKRERDKLKKK